MPDDERPSLEAPQLFGRRRGRKASRTASETVETTTETAPETAPKTTPGAASDPAPSVTDATTTSVPVTDEPAFADAGADATAVLPATDVAVDDPVEEPVDEPSPRVRRTRRPRPARSSGDRPPLLTGPPAALLVGLLVGGALLALVWVGFQGCEAARGTTSCGTAPGMAALVVIFVLAVAIGGLLLSRCGVPDPGATSFLGVGLTGVVYLLGVDWLDNWGVLVVVPVVTALTFLLSWWVTTTFVEVD